MTISLITCTGGRPEAFARLEYWMAKQRFDLSRVQWIVVDDCEIPTVCRMGQTVIRPTPTWEALASNTLGRNLSIALDHVDNAKVLFIEDDEAYLPDYVLHMSWEMRISELAGQRPARYYHVGQRVWRVLENPEHASLCQTGIDAKLIPQVKQFCQSGSGFAGSALDLRLWRAAKSPRLLDYYDCVSMKGLPGRAGIGIGHTPQGPGWHADADLAVLKSWIGSSGAGMYAKFAV